MQEQAILERLQQEDVLGQLRRRDGLMAHLGSENGELKLDWVEGIARLLQDDHLIEDVEQEAHALWEHGIRHLIWAGMGGSIITVRVLVDLGFGSGLKPEEIAIYPLDSTDPASLNTILRRIAQAKGLPWPLPTPLATDDLHRLLDDVMMVGVSMGMTSEEPITHLHWFTGLLEQAKLLAAEHIFVMTLPGSYLDLFAQERQAPRRPLQLDHGTGTGGRMSAPTTRVFLLPAALALHSRSSHPGQLRAVLRQAWQNYDLERATHSPEQHPFVQIAVRLAEIGQEGASHLFLQLPGEWKALVPWIEQLMEESLGKGGKGIVVFPEQMLQRQAPGFTEAGRLHVQVTTEPSSPLSSSPHVYTLTQPYLVGKQPHERLASLATNFLGWQLTMAIYGYLHQIQFAGQPAVENYKARARALRDLPDPFQVLADWKEVSRGEYLTLYVPPSLSLQHTPAQTFAQALKQVLATQTISSGSLAGYLDFTSNGELSPALRAILTRAFGQIGNQLLGIPVKFRQAPADYHSTEQGEMDGPPQLVSLRLLQRPHEPLLLGSYSDAFLNAQAISTWQAMIEQGRACFLLLADGTVEQIKLALQQFTQEVIEALQRDV
ncbi:hypothetical protein [Tengunoibacter tsumagoiensis]|uniref:Glucose-6-phosphate isomerase n=1 Tax=Tengunoibacter tsumagoiensis TaxID=2014871 RepID=A0A402A1I2_9CHLR|nr:hypothetical protein [Tengunoibacter tsumagoiensis]GCE12916.1 glucose-6-phosphate isomerase [Tengunoibacter tsumagoiensis]